MEKNVHAHTKLNYMDQIIMKIAMKLNIMKTMSINPKKTSSQILFRG